MEISGNHVHDIPALGCPENGGAGIETGEYTVNSSIIGNLVHDIGEFPPARACTEFTTRMKVVAS